MVVPDATEPPESVWPITSLPVPIVVTVRVVPAIVALVIVVAGWVRLYVPSPPVPVPKLAMVIPYVTPVPEIACPTAKIPVTEDAVSTFPEEIEPVNDALEGVTYTGSVNFTEIGSDWPG